MNKQASVNSILRFVNKTVRLEFLAAIVIQKALPNAKVLANYKADDEGIPFSAAAGGSTKNVGADIDVFEEKVHAIIEPTISNAESFHTDHELPSIRKHVLDTNEKDLNDKNFYNDWFALFIASKISRNIGNQVALIRNDTDVEIYPWEIKDFVEHSQDVKKLTDYKTIRPYAKIRRMQKA